MSELGAPIVVLPTAGAKPKPKPKHLRLSLILVMISQSIVPLEAHSDWLDGAHRYKYELDEPLNETTNSAELLHKQLLSLRDQLELELEHRKQRHKLNSPCLKASDCSSIVGKAHCNATSFTCTCQHLHVADGTGSCLPPLLLGDQCHLDEQCSRKVAGSECQLNQADGKRRCSCAKPLGQFRRDRCLPASKLNEYCVGDWQCRLAGNLHARCQWKIQNIYGTCKCPPNYQLIGASCMPRLGDFCATDAECLATTARSECGQSQEPPRWSSGNALATNGTRCVCQVGLQADTRRLSCVAHPKPTPVSTLKPEAPVTSTTSGPRAQNQQMAAEQRKLNALIANASEPISLGLACDSDEQCRAADPNSRCLAARCECLLAGGECSASRRGCPAHTFQCRRSGRCISWYFVCDGRPNCSDASDELGCFGQNQSAPLGGLTCPQEAFRCLDSSGCISRAKICDSQRDCRDASDELNCQETANSQIERSVFGDKLLNFRCHDGQFLPGHVLCNNLIECRDASDELLCNHNFTAAHDELTGSSKSQREQQELQPAASDERDSPLVKLDRLQINQMLAKLVAKRTPESRGHRRRSLPTSRTPSDADSRPTTSGQLECPAHVGFVCANGKCRSSALLCSGVDGCGDNSDEHNCQVCRCLAPQNSPPAKSAGGPHEELTWTRSQHKASRYVASLGALVEPLTKSNGRLRANSKFRRAY